MKYISFFILSGICLFHGCTKSSAPTPNSTPDPLVQDSVINPGNPTNPPSTADSIYYVDIPDVTIKSIFSYHTYPGNCFGGLPQDTQVVASFDLDGDLVNDIFFNCTNFYTGQSASVPCANYKNTIRVCTSDIASVDSILVLPTMPWCDSLSFNENIGPGQLFYPSSAPVYLYTQSFFYSFGMNKDTYIGIKLRRNNVNIYGWLLVSLGADNSITFKSYALNLRNMNDINAGQTF